MTVQPDRDAPTRAPSFRVEANTVALPGTGLPSTGLRAQRRRALLRGLPTTSLIVAADVAAFAASVSFTWTFGPKSLALLLIAGGLFHVGGL